MQVARRGRADAGGVGVDIEHIGYERRRGSGEVDALDAPGNLCLGGFAEFQLVKGIACDPVVFVGIPQSVERTEGIVWAWSRQFLMSGPQPECRRDGRKARVERRQLHLEAALLLLVGKNL